MERANDGAGKVLKRTEQTVQFTNFIASHGPATELGEARLIVVERLTGWAAEGWSGPPVQTV